MKCWFACLAVLIAGCSALPEEGPAMTELHGRLMFREVTALPDTATAHVVVVPALAGGESKPAAEGDFPARTGLAIPFKLKMPASTVASGEYLVLAQVIDHGKVWYSNLSSPLRISFLAEPGDVVVELRREQF